MSTNIPDTHPLKPGYYYIDIKKGHVVAYPYGGITVTDDNPDAYYKLWHLSIWGTGYKIENFATRKYASVPDAVSRAVVELSDQGTMWNIQKAGDGLFRIVVPEKNLYWTETVIWGVRRFQLWGSDGSKEQLLSFKQLALN